MYDRVLYDRFAQDGRPIPNGMDHPRIIDMFENGKDWNIYSYLNLIPNFPPDKVALTHEYSSGVYPICIREPSIINSFTLNTLLYIAGDRTISLIRSGDIKLCWFIEKEPPKNVYQILEIDTVMKDWNISNYAIFCNIPFKFSSDHMFPSVSHEIEIKLTEKHINDVVRLPKRFNIFMNSVNLYDWRLLCLDLLYRAKIIKNSIFSFDDSISMGMSNTNSIKSDEINTYLRLNEHSIRGTLSKYGYGFLDRHNVLENSAFSIVIEAYLNYDTVVNYPFITEKTMRPIAIGQPFMIYGQAHSLPYLHERGYRTFHPHIDESYDRIENDLLRLKTVTAEIARISAMPPNEFETLLRKIKPIVEHNIAQTKRNIDTYWTRIFART
jgi:hypothetical protein